MANEKHFLTSEEINRLDPNIWWSSYGWRGKIGVVFPAPGNLMEQEFHSRLPEGVIATFTKQTMKEVTAETLATQEDTLVAAAKLLAEAHVDVIAHACTTGSLIKGFGYDQKLTKMVEDTTGIPTITTATAMLEALKAMKIKKVAVAAPYLENVCEIEKKFLEDNGFTVTIIRGLGLSEPKVITGCVHSHVVYNLAKSVDSPEADGIFISSTGFRSFDVIEPLEKDLGKPVIGANQATMWLCLKKIGVQDHIPGGGQLLNEAR